MCRKLVLAATALLLVAGPAASADAPALTKADRERREIATRLDPLEASLFWSQEFEARPKDEEAGLRLAASLRALGRFERALEVAEAVTLLNPRSLEALLETARIHIAQGRGFYAIEPASKAQAMAPKDWRIPSLLGVALEQADRADEAEAAYRQALGLSPGNAAVINNLAMLRAGQGQPQEAERLLRQAIASPGATKQMRVNLSLVIGLQGRLDEAERILRQELPPELVNNNIGYLRAATSPAPAPAPAANTPVAPTRSWEAVRNAG